ncbi:MAG TPA: hypothetical protein VHL34_03275 [Rhizomicrobium sp.]|nr:hypothetical protein [Rhizomicrobium sp.]
MTFAPCAASSVIAPEIRKDIDCMVNALKSVPGVDRVTTGVSDAPRPDGSNGWTYPFIDYRGSNKAGEKQMVRFIAVRNVTDGHFVYSFTTMLNGLTVIPTRDAKPASPDDWNAFKVASVWKARCGVYADAVFN